MSGQPRAGERSPGMTEQSSEGSALARSSVLDELRSRAATRREDNELTPFGWKRSLWAWEEAEADLDAALAWIDKLTEWQNQARNFAILVESYLYDGNVSEGGITSAIQRLFTDQGVELPENKRALEAEAWIDKLVAAGEAMAACASRTASKLDHAKDLQYATDSWRTLLSEMGKL